MTTSHPPDLGPIPTYHLSDPINPTSDLIFPTIFLYPLTAQTDLIAEFPLSSTLHGQLSVVLEDHPTWDTSREYSLTTVECLMEIDKDDGARGLIKIPKSTPLSKAVNNRVIHDGILRIFILPKSKVVEWITEWKIKNSQA
jgi:tetratricopeptide repeat protein 4